MASGPSMLKRLFDKLILEIMPAALASVLGGFLFNHALHALMPEPAAAVHGQPASAQMMQLVADEHALMVDYLKTRQAAEQRQHDEQDEARRASGVTKPAAPLATPHRPAVALAAAAIKIPVSSVPQAPAAKVTTSAVPAVPGAPLMVAQAEPLDGAEAPARDRGILARTLAIKDNVVGATQRVVTAIGGIPSWIASSLGDRASPPAATPSAPFNARTASAAG